MDSQRARLTLQDRARIRRAEAQNACAVVERRRTVTRRGRDGYEIVRIVVSIKTSVIQSKSGRRVCQRRRRSRSLKTSLCTITNKIDNARTGRACTGKRGRVADERNFARRRTDGNYSGRIRGRQVICAAGTLRFLDEIILPRLERGAGQRRDIPCRALRRECLHRPTAQVNRSGTSIYKLDVIIL